VVNIGIHIEPLVGIGDKVQYSALPECFYKYYGIKLIDVNKSWVFDHSPYVRRDVADFFPLKFKNKEDEKTGMPCIYSEEKDWINSNYKKTHTLNIDGETKHVIIAGLWRNFDAITPASRSELFNSLLGIDSRARLDLDFPRGPRLYRYEDPHNVKPDQIAIHIGPSHSTSQVIPDHVLNEIKNRYSNYNIIQIGSEKDNDFCWTHARHDHQHLRNDFPSFVDKRGVDIWETVKIIAESAIFIGINSGPMNIANCYPHINKKLILLNDGQWEKEAFCRFEPLSARLTPSFGWVDFGWQYYTTDDYDVGRMYSYKKI
tara:strand:- start:499 stop:1446 length:948 start_codon:yes stop_codon:yes gene_type:complete